MKKHNQYVENEAAGNSFRNTYLQETLKFIDQEKQRANRIRETYFAPDTSSGEAYTASIQKFREEYKKLLGLPYFQCYREEVAGEVWMEKIGEDTDALIFRTRIPVMQGLCLYGLLFQNTGSAAPLVVVQHGGQGTPELCGGFFGSDNYNEIIRRFLRKGVHVFAPQLLLYQAERFGDKYDRPSMDTALKQLGTSMAALHVFELQKALDWLAMLPFVDEKRIGMAGLSYGGFYTLMAAAADTRIRAAYVAGIFNDRFRYNWADMTMPGQASKFMDAEIAGLICPRPLFIECGSDDELFDAESARIQSEKVSELYAMTGLSDSFCFRIFSGTHEFCRSDEGVEFLVGHL